MYDTPFHRPPVDGVLYVIDPDAVKALPVEQCDRFLQSRVLKRILRPISGDEIASAAGDAWAWQRRAAAPSVGPSP